MSLMNLSSLTDESFFQGSSEGRRVTHDPISFSNVNSMYLVFIFILLCMGKTLALLFIWGVRHESAVNILKNAPNFSANVFFLTKYSYMAKVPGPNHFEHGVYENQAYSGI